MTRIIFMGTPDFSVPALKALAARPDFEICLVVTQPDRPKGRGKKLSASPVKQAALQMGLPVYQPEKLNRDEAYDTLAALAPDYFVVVAYGQILSQKVLDLPRRCPINIHGSLLPRYRGAAPIQAAVLNMDKETGVTTMVMARQMDAGDMLLKAKTPIHPEDTAQDLHDRLSALGGDLIVETIDRMNKGALTPVPQDHELATYVGLLKKSDGRIDWGKSRRAVIAHINAMTPWPGAFTRMGEKRLKIFRATPGDAFDASFAPAPGTLIRCGSDGIHAAAQDGIVIIRELMGTSGKRLAADAFLRGNPIDLPACFE